MGSKPKQAPEKKPKSQRRRVVGETKSPPAKANSSSSSAAHGIIGLSREPVLIVRAHDLQIIDANPAASELYGYSVTELLAMNLLALSPDRERDMARTRLLRSSRGKKEFQHIGKNGQSIFVEFDNAAFSYAGEEAFVCLIHDITTRSQLVRALLESDATNREIIENASDIIYTHDLEGNFTSGNRAVTRVLGYSREEYLGVNIRKMVHPDDVQRSLTAIAAKLQGKPAPSPYAVRVYAKDGTLRTLELSTRLIYRDGKPIAVQGVARDVTEREKTQAEIRASEEKYRRLFERNLAGVYVSTLDGNLIDCNESFAHIFGYLSREEVLQVDAREFSLHEQDREGFIRGLRQRRMYTNLESRCRRKDGSPFWILENVALLESSDGEPDRIQGTMIDITERKLAEQALVESETKFRAVADTAASAIYIHDGERFLYVNRASEEISGYSAAELLQMSAFSIVHPDDRGLTIERGTARQRGDAISPRYEFRIVAKDGSTKWLDFSASSVRFEGRDAILATAFDITERKRVERIQTALYQIAERASSAEDLQFFYCAIHSIVSELMYAKNLYIALYDEQTDRISYPYYVDEQDQGPVGAFAPGKGRTEYVLRHGQAALITPQEAARLSANGEVELVGSECVDWLGAPLKSGTQNFGVIAVQSYSESIRYSDRDREVLNFVSQHLANAILRKRNEEALRDSEQRYRSLVQSAVYGIYRSGTEDRFLEVNPALVKMLGYDDAKEVLDLSLQHDVYLDADERAILVDKYSKGGIIENVEVRWRRNDGKTITVRLSGRAVSKPDGSFDSFEMIAEDVTERRNLEDQLRQSQKMEAVGRLAGGVAHDFNNLLTVIKGYTELMLEEFREHDPLRGELEEIRKAADRAAGLTRQLLAFSRQQVLAPKVLDLNSVVNNMEKLVRRLLGGDVELSTNLDPSIGRIKADPGQLEQVIMNLAVNARDAMPVGGSLVIETANIELDDSFARDHVGSRAGAYVMLAVTDTGIGMTETVRQRIFEPFFTTKEAGKGTGLGLSTVYGIVKQSGGYIWVYSEVSVGTTFKVYLPRVDAPADALMARMPLNESTFGRETVLLVEDEDGVRALVRQVLYKHGYNVLEARNGGEALLHCEHHRGAIELLLTDVVLDQMGGPELAKRLVALRTDMKVLFISGYTDDAIIHHGVSAGTAFLQKPFTTDALARKVREVLDAPVPT